MASSSQTSSTTSTPLMPIKELSKPITSFGPAGSKLGVREAGESIANIFCHRYPDTETHSIIPNLFIGNITELMEPRSNLTRREEDQLRGRMINQVGEGHENVVFNLFLRLIRQSPDISPTLLVMRQFEMDTKNAVGLKRSALMAQLPGLNLKSAITTAENDFVVLVKDCGIVFLEVKGSTKDNNVRSAEKQLANVNAIVQSVMTATTGQKNRIIPKVKLIVVPDCTDPSPSEKTSQGSFLLFKDSCENFKEKWIKVVEELRRLNSPNPFSSEEFKQLSYILLGIWSAKVVSVENEGRRIYELKQDETNVSYVEQLKKIDTVVDTCNVRNEDEIKFTADKMNPLTTLVRTTDQDVFRSCNNIKLCYLTPEQKELFSFHQHAIVLASAGCGKSLLLLFKVIELINTSKSRILILAPRPHYLRILNALRSNNVLADVIYQFPPPPSSHNVFVMDINTFFADSSTTMDYNLTDYHVFADDVQHMTAGGFIEVGDFIEQTYKTCVQHNTYCWFMVDTLQGKPGDHVEDYGRCSHALFKTHNSKPRVYTIPVISLTYMMRNTHEVMKLIKKTRGTIVRLDFKDKIYPSTPQVGHKVTSRTPIYHRLNWRGKQNSIMVMYFIIARLRKELQSVTRPPYSLPLSSVAIIWENEIKYPKEITSFLRTEFATTPQTIEEQLISNNTSDIIMDEMDNTMSFESPVVVFLGCNISVTRLLKHAEYRIFSRARVMLSIIGLNAVHLSPDPFMFYEPKLVDIVDWKVQGFDLGDRWEFVRCNSPKAW